MTEVWPYFFDAFPIGIVNLYFHGVSAHTSVSKLRVHAKSSFSA